MPLDNNGPDFLCLADLIHEVYDGDGELKLSQYRSALELTSFELRSTKQIQSALNSSYGTARYVISYLLENELLEVAKKTRGGKEWYARTYKDVLALVFDQLYRRIENKMSEKGTARAEVEMVMEHCNLIFKAIFEQIESQPFDLRWKAIGIAGLDLMLEKRASNSYGLPKLCTCPYPSISRKCEQCGLKKYSIDYALSRYLDPFSKARIKPVLVSKEVKAIKKIIAPEPSREVIECARDFKRNFSLLWNCTRLFCNSDELFRDGKLNIESYDSKILSSFRKIVSPI